MAQLTKFTLFNDGVENRLDDIIGILESIDSRLDNIENKHHKCSCSRKRKDKDHKCSCKHRRSKKHSKCCCDHKQKDKKCKCCCSHK